MSNIKDKLDELSDLRSALDTIALEKQATIDSVLTLEIKNKLAEIDAEFAGKSEVASGKAEALEAEIKELVKAGAETVKGNWLMAVWNKGRVTWDTKSLEGYAVAHPELLNLRKEGEPTVTIRRI